jgi:hypothetical protein
LLKYLFLSSEYIDNVELFGKRLGSFGVDEDRMQCVSSSHRSVDNDVPFGNKHAGHVTTGGFASLSQRFVSQSLKHGDAGICWFVYSENHYVVPIKTTQNPSDLYLRG